MRKKIVSLFLACLMPAPLLLSGCGDSEHDGKTVIELVQYV